MGLSLHNGYEKPATWGYVFGIFTGMNARDAHGIGVARVYGETVANPSELAGAGPRTEVQPEVFLHLSRNARGIAVQSDSDKTGGGMRYSTAVSLALDLDPRPYQDFGLRLAGEFLVKYEGLSLAGVAYAGYVEIDDDSDLNLAMTGLLCQTSYRFCQRWEMAARYALVDIDDRILNDSHERTPGLAQATKEEEASLALNVYLIEHSLKWQNDLNWRRHTMRDHSRIDIIGRSQFQLAF